MNEMRKVILFMHVSLDGYICGPRDEMDWTTMNDEDMGAFLIADLQKTVMFGGASTAAHFAKNNLIDEYRIKLEPTVLGKGKSLFKDIPQRVKLKLIKSKIFDSGVAGLYYEVIK
jgi:dihydrofolate reductase